MPLDIFQQHRSRLFGIAYRMLGSRVDAEDALQDIYLRWHAADHTQLQMPEAWLVTVTTRLCIDRLRAAKVEREHYVGPWLPEPLITEFSATESAAEIASELSIALLNTLERLSPEERAAFLLREIFDVDYAEIARILDKSEDACRQLVHRAKVRVREDRPRFEVSATAHRELLEKFVAASRSGNHQQMLSVLAPNALMVSDGGGKVIAALRVLHGAERLMRLFAKIIQRGGEQVTYQLALVNGELGVLRFLNGAMDSVYAFVTDGVHIHEIYAVRNPDKLNAITLQ
ncbi:MAG: polymerase sigma-70, type [Verrucomicrobiaceae bacterium]|nr:polymerase sigma-70, type [Verrucomicrobiaceae bacterium]